MKRLYPILVLLFTSIAVAGSVGESAPDGTKPQLDYPSQRQEKNIASRGLGCCVFRSLHHAGDYQDVRCLYRMPEWMVSKGIEGGGYPEKVDKLIPMIAKDRGVPTPEYVQVEGMDLAVLKLACKTGRMPCVTYCRSATGRYNGQRIAHMVNLVAAGVGNGPDGKGWYVVLDNNYPGGGQYEWLSEAEFLRTYDPGWCVILLAPPPTPRPLPFLQT